MRTAPKTAMSLPLQAETSVAAVNTSPEYRPTMLASAPMLAAIAGAKTGTAASTQAAATWVASMAASATPNESWKA